jgi:hypothetical protein
MFTKNDPHQTWQTIVSPGFEDSDRLWARGHPAMAVVRAVGTVEVFLKYSYFPYWHRKGPGDCRPPTAQELQDLRYSFRKSAEKLFNRLRIPVREWDSWSRFVEAAYARNGIVHEGWPCTPEEAQKHVRSCGELAGDLMKYLAKAKRWDGRPTLSAQTLQAVVGAEP